MRLRWMLIVVSLALASRVDAQAALPPRWSDLPKLAATWPPAWASLVNDVMPRDDFEKGVMQRVGALVRAEPASKETYRLAETVLAATLRHHQSVRRTAPLADNPAQSLHAELEESLANVRKDWLQHLQKTGADAEAQRLAELWLPVTPADSPLGSAIAQLWIQQAKAELEKSDYSAARTWLKRLEKAFGKAPDELRKPLHECAASLLKDSAGMPDAPAIRALEEALTLWPRLPEARDDLERRKGTFKTLVVAVRSLPEQLSPATACTEIERQSLELLFDRLYHVERSSSLGQHYRPQLATSLPVGSLTASIALRKNVYWSTGERLTAADLRQTALLMNQADAAGRSALWRDYLEIPTLEGNPFHVNVGYRQGLFDPLAPLTFWILPEYYHGKQLQRGDDPEFAGAPIGSGPYQYLGRKQDVGRSFAVFLANPHDLRQGPGSLREIRLTSWTEAAKDLPRPLPQLILDPPTDRLPALKELGYVEKEVKNSTCVHFLAVNHRKASLASVSIRRAIAHALDRRVLLNKHFRGKAFVWDAALAAGAVGALLNEHFRSEASPSKYHAAANGLFPPTSWANAPAPRVDAPDDLYQPEQARSLARKAKEESAKVAWTLKYPGGDAHVKAACEEMARDIAALLQEAKIDADVQPTGLPPHALQKAIDERDYDLLYTSAARMDDPARLALLFDRHDDATRAGGSNYLGYENDVKLHELLRAAVQHRQFSAVQETMQAVHVHLHGTMPIIPLWQLDVHVLALPTLRTPPLDPRAVFANVREWKIAP
jgi:ABC-type transport system substrate-binding protein